MIVGDRPTPIRQALWSSARAPHRFEPPDMSDCKRLAGAWVVPQMQVDRIASAIGVGDRIDRAIGLGRLDP